MAGTAVTGGVRIPLLRPVPVTSTSTVNLSAVTELCATVTVKLASVTSTAARADSGAARRRIARRKLERREGRNTGWLLSFRVGALEVVGFLGRFAPRLEAIRPSLPDGGPLPKNLAMRGPIATFREHQEPLGRWTGFVVFAVMIARQFTFWPGFRPLGVEQARWLLVTTLFVLFWSAYWRR